MYGSCVSSTLNESDKARKLTASRCQPFPSLVSVLVCFLLLAQFRIQDLTGTFFGKANGPVRVNPISFYRWTEM